jgi:hypothetical protein
MKQVKYESINTYIQCYCEREQTILLGWGIILYANILTLICCLGISILFLVSAPIGLYSFIFPGFIAVFAFLFWWNYRECFKDMISAGHSRACSKKVALRAMWRQSLYSCYVIDVDPVEVDPQGDYGTPAVGLWFATILVNTIFLVQYAYETSVSVVYPVLFTLSMIASTILLVRIKHMRVFVTILCILNIFTSGMMLTFYLLALLVKPG